MTLILKSKAQAKRTFEELDYQRNQLVTKRSTLYAFQNDVQDKRYYEHERSKFRDSDFITKADLALEVITERTILQLDDEILELEVLMNQCRDKMAEKKKK